MGVGVREAPGGGVLVNVGVGVSDAPGGGVLVSVGGRVGVGVGGGSGAQYNVMAGSPNNVNVYISDG